MYFCERRWFPWFSQKIHRSSAFSFTENNLIILSRRICLQEEKKYIPSTSVSNLNQQNLTSFVRCIQSKRKKNLFNEKESPVRELKIERSGTKWIPIRGSKRLANIKFAWIQPSIASEGIRITTVLKSEVCQGRLSDGLSEIQVLSDSHLRLVGSYIKYQRRRVVASAIHQSRRPIGLKVLNFALLLFR